MLLGCADLAYYHQAVIGQWELVQARRPVVEALADPLLAPQLRQRLEIAQTLRHFASAELGLPKNGSYSDYADLGRPYVVRSVFAAPELALAPHRWCYLVIGCLSYRGFFDAAAAQRFADELRAAGDDVYVADTPAYSTLGWFDDPLLNTFLHWPVTRLAELLFHELAHQRLYIADDTAFNEAFATAIGYLGVERWLKQRGSTLELEQYQIDRRRREDFLRLVTHTRARLSSVYASTDEEAVKRGEKQRILTETRDQYRQLKQEWGGYAAYDRWFAQDLNNAKLAGSGVYNDWVPAFLTLYERTGRDFTAFYKAVDTLGQLPADERMAQLNALLASTPYVGDSPIDSTRLLNKAVLK
jgi:predicted aminopeptidase